MRLVRYLIGFFAVGMAVGTGCGSSDEGSAGGPVNKADSGDVATGGTTVSGGTGGSTAGTSGTSAGGSTTGGTTGTTGGTAGSSGDAGPPGPACTTNSDCTAPDQCVFGHCGTVVTATCQGKIYECGDGLDNDNDGLTDMNDPDCLGPCQNNETGFIGCISGQNNAPCKSDCWWDQDTGSGNDGCYWDHMCDPLETQQNNFSPEGPGCPYNPDTNVSGTGFNCADLQAAQPDPCGTYCGPLTPNGCDCFGCCELPPESGKYVWVGSTSDNTGKCEMGTCTLDSMGDPSLCKPCTPVQSCLNKCEHCELCVGKTELPADCFETPDAGPPPPPPDGPCIDQTCAGGGQACNCGEACPTGLVCSGGCCICPSPLCPTGIQSCGLSCLPACPAGYYCNTGCCQQVPA